MIFTTWPFFFFMAAVFVCYWWAVPARWRKPFLLLASLAYFTYSYPPHTLLLAGLSATVYLIGNAIHRARHEGARASARRLVIVGIAVCAATLGVFKYSAMLVGLWNGAVLAASPSLRLDVPKLLVPLGISFFTFEFIHYLADLYNGRVKRVGPVDFGLFAFFFPSLVSGPVKRFQIFQEQGEALEPLSPALVHAGLVRIVTGIAKKVVIADTASIAAHALVEPGGAGRVALWIAMYAYAVKIYYDFSGYTDIAIGCGRLLGYRLPENFAKPYRQPNIARFWNCWHMSLSSWIRDYLFIPLGGSRGSRWRTIVNLVLVMTICGLWHGANWNFVVWGLWHGAGLGAMRLWKAAFPNVPDTPIIRALGVAVTVQFVCFGWVLFAAPDLPTAIQALRRMIG